MISTSDIFVLECPETRDIVGLSKEPFPELPYSIKRSYEFKHNRARLFKKGLTYRLKVLDIVPSIELDLIFDMYLNLFRGWNYPLYNFKPTSVSKLEFVLKSKLRVDDDKHLIEDLPYLLDCLKKIAYHARKIRMKKEKEIYFEMIFIIYYSISTDLNWSKLKNISSFIEPVSPQLRECQDWFHQIVKTRNSNYIFHNIRDYEYTDIIRCINYIMTKFQIQVIYNSYLWKNAHHTYGYLKEFNEVEKKLKFFKNKYENMLRVEKDFFRADNKLSVGEFLSISQRFEELI